ncbi:ATP-binding cassette domain-containing protein [Clostridium sp. MSJ-4]|uniref:ATP-binding cassette domain-containing protein n=1 Tax=Clostridium simiarum TaxID=2841506 RepID=A0ABS6F447_9CLOT|nr:ATP-binding cassette domain-containing protein [Clostridium simiarum]MBU5593297.1 ATP-binding cassette domain-containing protein [Clostridium simiarum]
MEAFGIRELTFTYPLKEAPALKNINLTINQGEFLVICGKSGCGKSTLLRHLKTTLTPHGTRSGEILFNSKPIEDITMREQASQIGYVLQSPDNQIVTDKVWHELAFGLESLGYDNKTIRLRVAEMASFFGIQTWFMKDVTELSGGQKQLLNLASIMAMQPLVLLLDEPTSQLDPIAASDFLQTIKKINRDLGTTIIMTEHHLEEVFTMADRVVVMDEGEIIANDIPQKVGRRLKEINHEMFVSMPSSMKIHSMVENKLSCPITVREGRNWINELLKEKDILHRKLEEIPRINYEDKSMKKRNKILFRSESEDLENIAIKLEDVWFKYDKNLPDVVKDLSLEVKRGELYCIVGGNGTGKTTTLSIINGINKPYRGKVFIDGKDIRKMKDKELFTKNLGVLPQNPQVLFVKKTVELDLHEMLSKFKLSKEERVEKVKEIAKLVEIEHLLDMHPYDLSGGEQQRAALAKVLLLEPKIILLDEPTKGLDGHFKEKLYKILKKLLNEGVTVVMVSHDIEFCAEYADRCALFFDGNIVTYDTPNKFFSGNSFYTTAANRMSRHVFENTVTCEDVISLCNLNMSKVK